MYNHKERAQCQPGGWRGSASVGMRLLGINIRVPQALGIAPAHVHFILDSPAASKGPPEVSTARVDVIRTALCLQSSPAEVTTAHGSSVA